MQAYAAFQTLVLVFTWRGDLYGDLHLTCYVFFLVGDNVMNKIESKLHVPSEADALLMVKLFSYCPEGSWIRPADFPTSDSVKRVISNWVEKGFVYYVQDQVSNQWLLVLDDKCVQRCWEVLAAASEVRMERSMLDQKPKSRKMSPRTWAAAAVLVATLAGLLVAMVTALW